MREVKLEDFLDPDSTFAKGAAPVTVNKPEANKRERVFAILQLDDPTEGGPQVVLLAFQLIEQLYGRQDPSNRPDLLRLQFFAQFQEIRRVALMHRTCFPGRKQALAPVLAHRFQQSVSPGTIGDVVGKHERFADELRQQIQDVSLLDRLARPTPASCFPRAASRQT